MLPKFREREKKHPWPSGLRRLTQVQLSSDAWVRIPPDARKPGGGTMAEWLRRQIRNLMGLSRAGSNPAGVGESKAKTQGTKGTMAEWLRR